MSEELEKKHIMDDSVMGEESGLLLKFPTPFNAYPSLALFYVDAISRV